MNTFTALQQPDDLAGLTWSVPELALDPNLFRRHRPDAHWVVNDSVSGHTTARCSLWWTEVPVLPGEKIGAIGHYAASQESSGRDLLNHACEELRRRGCTLAVGPMDGNTWRSYRLVTGHGDPEPARVSDASPLAPFFLEPTNPAEWPAHFRAGGFGELAQYTSALNSNLSYVDPRIERTLARLESNGIRIRPIDLNAFEQDLDAIYQVSVQSFQSNYLYTPIGRDEFLQQYQPVQKWVKPELVRLAFLQEQPVGFVFAIPDLLQARQGLPVSTAILKTVAVVPGRASAGLGSVLVSSVHTEALRLGFSQVVHALMHESNNSKNISGHYARTIRRYTLFSRSLQ
jgi:GNAT superfamily N-acetyltransferase